MKVPVMSMEDKEAGKKELPIQFNEEFRPDIIKRAVIAVQQSKRQPYGAFPMAGKQSSAVVSRRRRDYRGSYGMGISRVPRKVLSRRGRRMSWVGAFAPGMVGGRRAHPPKAEKIWTLKVNKKERRKAIRSALSATMNKNIVAARGHLVPENFPFIINADFENISKAKEMYKHLNSLGFSKELERNSERKVRAGRGKSRGRKYRQNAGMLIVVSGDCSLLQKCTNLQGVEVATIGSINAEMLAPGTNAGRLVLFTEAAIDKMAQTMIFTDSSAFGNDSKSQEAAKPAIKKSSVKMAQKPKAAAGTPKPASAGKKKEKAAKKSE